MIIGDGIMLGAGGESASIFVTGLSETDSITAVQKIPTKVLNPDSLVPNGYTQLEYIESTGTQYIDTGYKPNPNTVMSMDLLMSGTFKPYTTYGGDGSIFGTTDSTNACYCANFGGGSDQGNQLIIWPQTTYDSGGKAGDFYINDTIRTTRNTLTIDNGNATWGSISITIPVKTTSLSTSLLLFGVRYSDGTIKQFTSYNMRLFEWRVEENGVVVRNSVPAKRNSDGAIGMYDLVTETFFENAGTGTFTVGVEIPQYIDGYVDGKTIIGKWTQIPNPAYVALPDGYTQLEYIESTGTQYIDTGVLPNQNTNVKLDFVYTGAASTTWYPLFGVHDANNQYYFSFVNTNTNAYSFGFSTQEYYPIGTYSSARRTLAIQNGSLVIDGAIVKTANPATFAAVNSVYLFALNRKGTVDSRITSMRCYSFKVEKEGSLVRHFIPSKRNSDGVNGMYDLISSTFFENAGTGTFTAGAEVPQTIDGFLIDKIKSYGTWNISNGDGTKTTDVLIDAAAEFEVTL